MKNEKKTAHLLQQESGSAPEDDIISRPLARLIISPSEAYLQAHRRYFYGYSKEATVRELAGPDI